MKLCPCELCGKMTPLICGECDDTTYGSALEERVDECEQLRAENAELRAEVKRWKPRQCWSCGCQVTGASICRNCSGIEHGDG